MYVYLCVNLCVGKNVYERMCVCMNLYIYECVCVFTGECGCIYGCKSVDLCVSKHMYGWESVCL